VQIRLGCRVRLLSQFRHQNSTRGVLTAPSILYLLPTLSA
jgi:hypothetical protein